MKKPANHTKQTKLHKAHYPHQPPATPPPPHHPNYRRGSASLYIVIFTTLLLSVITMGFIRIMLSEAIQTSNYDLSQSAYDSALAGIEDAKVALLKYHECLSTNDQKDTYCSAIRKNMQDSSTSCDGLRNILKRDGEDNKETFIESSTTDKNTISEMDQAYTCVLISEITPDYLTSLDDRNRTRMIPLRTDTSQLNALNRITLQWFTDSNGTFNPATKTSTPAKTLFNKIGYKDITGISDWLPSVNTYAKTPSPPIITLQLIQATTSFYLDDFNQNKGAYTNRGTLVLFPSTNTNAVTEIENTSNAGLAASADKSINNLIPIKCDNNLEYKCTAAIDLPKPYNSNTSDNNRNSGATFLKITLPYGTPATDIKITMHSKSASDQQLLQFVGVQARVDSTGRTNDLFRRVEARIELVDTYFPFPEFAVSLNGNNTNTLKKDFWVTTNNWYGPNYGTAD
jgi:Tfp pilus assembly protein PilX